MNNAHDNHIKWKNREVDTQFVHRQHVTPMMMNTALEFYFMDVRAHFQIDDALWAMLPTRIRYVIVNEYDRTFPNAYEAKIEEIIKATLAP